MATGGLWQLEAFISWKKIRFLRFPTIPKRVPTFLENSLKIN